MYEFDQDTRVEKESNLRFLSRVDAGWNIGDNPNGGYLISLVDRAIRDVVTHPDAVSLTTHFLRPGVAGEPCVIDVEIVRAGRTLTTVRANLSQQGKVRLVVMAAYADLAEPMGPDTDITVPERDMLEPEACIPRTGDLQGIDIALVNKLDVRIQPDLATPGESGVAEIAGWIRHKDGRQPDVSSLLLFVDCFPPSPLGALGAVGWVPSVELTVHVRCRPAPGWIKASLRTDDLTEGRMIETGCFWDSTGALVAQSRQLALVRD